MKRHQAKEKEEKEAIVAAQVRLLKLKLEEAQKKSNVTKQESANQMDQHSLPRVKTGSHNKLGRRRGWGGLWDVCYACGQQGHWQRRCPNMRWHRFQGIPNKYGGGYGNAPKPAKLPPKQLPHHPAFHN